VEKYYGVGQNTDDKTAHAHYMLDTEGYKHRLCNTCSFSTATVVTRKRLNVTLYGHCLPYY